MLHSGSFSYGAGSGGGGGGFASIYRHGVYRVAIRLAWYTADFSRLVHLI